MCESVTAKAAEPKASAGFEVKIFSVEFSPQVRLIERPQQTGESCQLTSEVVNWMTPIHARLLFFHHVSV